MMTDKIDKKSLYFAGADEFPFVKVGISNNPEARIKAFSKNSPFDFKILAVFPDDSRFEKIIVRILKKQTVCNGEWFKKFDEMNFKTLVAQARAWKPPVRVKKQKKIQKKMSATAGGRIASARLRLGMSQKSFAAAVGLSKKHMNQIERGVVPVESVKHGTIMRMASVLGMAGTEFVELIETEDTNE